MDKKAGTPIWILVGCLGLFFVTVCGFAGAWALFLREPEVATPGPSPGPGPVPGPVVAADTPRRVVATVTAVTGSAPVSPGAACDFAVVRAPRDDGTFWCNAQITCGGQLLYGGPNAGFFPCTLYDPPARHVVGGESQTTQSDGDAALVLDTLQGTLTVTDDAMGRFGAFTLTAAVQSVQ